MTDATTLEALDKLRGRLRLKVHRYGLRRWCDAHRVSSSHASEFLTGRRLPTTDVLDALGMEWRIVRKRPTRARQVQPVRGDG